MSNVHVGMSIAPTDGGPQAPNKNLGQGSGGHKKKLSTIQPQGMSNFHIKHLSGKLSTTPGGTSKHLEARRQDDTRKDSAYMINSAKKASFNST